MKKAKEIRIKDVVVGGDNFVVIAGPCAVESEELLERIAESVKNSGAKLLRGGAYKPRTSPDTFQGLKADGVAALEKVREKVGIPVVSEVTGINFLSNFENIDVLQIGARNMQNFELLKAVGKSNKPVLLKRGFSATVDELLFSAKYVENEGNDKIILCERGIRTFEPSTRFTLDLSAVAVLKSRSGYPVIVDPSHALGHYEYVESMCKAAVAAGADGIMVEVHENPECALCDGEESVTTERFAKIVEEVKKIASAVGKKM